MSSWCAKARERRQVEEKAVLLMLKGCTVNVAQHLTILRLYTALFHEHHCLGIIRSANSKEGAMAKIGEKQGVLV